MADVYTRIGYIKGATGATGAQGAKGDTGDAATIQVGSVTTVPYGQTANVVNSGTEQAAVFDFTIPQGRPGQQTTEMDNLLLNSITTPAAEFPTPAIGDNGSTLFGKISKWFSDMAALVASKFDASNVVNNLTTTSSGYALDARQGKTLHDELSTYIRVAATAQITTETVWSNVQKATLVAPTVNGYKFLCWIGVETIGSVAVGYVASPYQANTYAYYPGQTANINVAGTALYVKNV